MADVKEYERNEKRTGDQKSCRGIVEAHRLHWRVRYRGRVPKRRLQVLLQCVRRSALGIGDIPTGNFRSDAYLNLTELKEVAMGIETRTGKKLQEYE